MIASVQDLVISVLLGAAVGSASMQFFTSVLHLWDVLAFALMLLTVWQSGKRWEAHLAEATEVARMRIALWQEEEASA